MNIDYSLQPNLREISRKRILIRHKGLAILTKTPITFSPNVLVPLDQGLRDPYALFKILFFDISLRLACRLCFYFLLFKSSRSF